MFDQFHTHVRQGPEHIDVREFRAPTDDSIRIVEEMREKLAESWIRSYRLQNNVFNGSWDAFYDNFGRTFRFLGKFKINGVDHETNFSVDAFDLKAESNKMVRLLHKHIVEQIAAVITIEILNSCQSS